MAMNYDDLIDDEVRAFIAHTESFYPPDAAELSVADQRLLYDAMCREFHQGYPSGVSAHDMQANGVPIRIYELQNPSVTVAYIHGGGFVLGGIESHDDVCAEICSGTGFRVISIDYRLAPEHVHPADFDDCLATVGWILSQYTGGMMLVGDSGGGTLAASMAHALRGKTDRILGQVLIYPALGTDLDSDAWIKHANAPLLTREDAIFYMQMRSGGADPDRNWKYAVLHDHDFTGVPPTVVVAAALDPLVDDGRIYRDRIRAAGGQAEWISETGLVHGYLRARAVSAKARHSFNRIVSDIRSLGSGQWPYE